MTSAQNINILCIAYLFSKHFLGDFVLQNSYQLTNKVNYGHRGGMLHAGIHGLLSLPLFWLVPHIGINLFGLIIIGEVVAHYHIDWGKEQLLLQKQWGAKDKEFWRLFGFDQLLHMATYLLMVYLVTTG